jgi:hypothetical protein
LHCTELGAFSHIAATGSIFFIVAASKVWVRDSLEKQSQWDRDRIPKHERVMCARKDGQVLECSSVLPLWIHVETDAVPGRRNYLGTANERNRSARPLDSSYAAPAVIWNFSLPTLPMMYVCMMSPPCLPLHWP